MYLLRHDKLIYNFKMRVYILFSLILMSSLLKYDCQPLKLTIEVTLKLFSGTENIKWTLTNKQVKLLEEIYLSNTRVYKPNQNVMGYKGFEVATICYFDDIITKKTIIGAPEVELYLLFTNPSLSFDIVKYVIAQIKNGYVEKDQPLTCGKENDKCAKNFESQIDFGSCCLDHYCDCDTDLKVCTCKKEITSDKPLIETDKCSNVPIRGPDTSIKYQPKVDDNGCFITRQYDNNCYNYASDIVTNTFAQPGRGSKHKWQVNTCDDIKRAALSDRLVWVDNAIPTSLPDKGHYVALLIWPGTNFHLVRMDSNMYWSHKPGGSAVKNVDNDGKVITNPSKQNFFPWTQYCGIFQVLPSIVQVN